MTMLQLVALIENIPLNKIIWRMPRNICCQCLVVRWC